MEIKVGLVVHWADVIIDIVKLTEKGMSLAQIQSRIEVKQEEYIIPYTI